MKTKIFKCSKILLLTVAFSLSNGISSYAHESLTAHSHDEEEELPQVIAPIFGEADTAERPAQGLTTTQPLQSTGDAQLDAILNIGNGSSGSASPKYGQMPPKETEKKRIYRTPSTRGKIYHEESNSHLHGVEMPKRLFNNID